MNFRRIVSTKVAGACGILGPLVIIFSILLSIYLNSWFKWADHALSNLGSLERSNNFVFNLGLVLSGTLGLTFSMRLPKILKRKLGLTGGLIFASGMIFMILIGIFPMGMTPHKFVSISFYALSGIALLIIGLDQLREPSERPWGVFILSLLVLAITSLLLLITIPYDLGVAIPEIIGGMPILEFSFVFGIRLLYTDS